MQNLLVQYHQYNLEPSVQQPNLFIQRGQLSDPAFVIGLLIAIAAHGWTSWKLPIKAGYEGNVKWLWFWLLLFPGTSVLALLVFCLLPWPLERQRGTVRSHSGMSVDEELKKLKRRNNL